MNTLKALSGKLLILPLLFVIAITLSACTNTDKSNDDLTDVNNDLEIIGEDDSVDQSGDAAQDSEDDTPTPVDDTPEPPTDETEEDDTPSNTDNGSTSGNNTLNTESKSISGSSASDGVFGAGYSYEVIGGQLVYEFIVSGGPADKPYPSSTAAYEGNNLVVIFPSLVNDYAIKESSMVLAGIDMTVQTTFEGGKSTYKFEVGSQKDFTFTTGTNADDKKVIFLKIKL